MNKPSSKLRLLKSLLVFLAICLLILLLFFSFCKSKKRVDKKYLKDSQGSTKEFDKKLCPHRDWGKLGGRDAARFLNDWECDYCGEIIKNCNFYQAEESAISLIEKHRERCEKFREVFNTIDKKINKSLIYDQEDSLKRKGYQSNSIRQLKSWGLINKIILPDLREKVREKAIKSLSVLNWEGVKIGLVGDLVTFLVPCAFPITCQNFLDLLNKERLDFLYTIHGSKIYETYEKALTVFFIWRLLQRKENWNYNVYVLETGQAQNISKSSLIWGDSSSLSFYLSLLSNYYQKPVSSELATTGAISFGSYSDFQCPQCLIEEIKHEPKTTFSKNRILQVGLLNEKLLAAVAGGIKKLILSVEQKEDYEKNVSQGIREKLTVYYIKNVEELEELFWKGEFS